MAEPLPVPRVPALPSLVASDYRLDQIVAVPNWRAVLWNGTQHVTQRVYVLGLATNTASSEPGLLVMLSYTPTGGWVVADLAPSFCGLLPPDWDLVPFEAANPCGHTPPSTGL